MQMSETTMVLDGKEHWGKGIKQTCSCAGNVVQVFGFKNIFIEAGYNGIIRKVLLPHPPAPQWPGKPFSNFLEIKVMRCYKGPKYSWRAKSDYIFHSAMVYGIASLHGESIKTTEVPEVLWRVKIENYWTHYLPVSLTGFMVRMFF